MGYEVMEEALARELEMRGIGFSKGEKYYVDVLQAAYLTEIGKAKYDDAVAKVRSDKRLGEIYAVFRDLRNRMHVANYIEKDNIILAYDKGMVPRRAESRFAVKVVESGGITLGEMIVLRDTVRKVRKDLIIAAIGGEGKVSYYKFQEIDM